MKALLIHNLYAGPRNRKTEIALAASRLVEAGWDLRTVSPEPESLGGLLKEAVGEGLDVAVVAGGDGSINLAIQSLACTETALGVIPTGTAHVWAREVGTPLDVRGATDVLLRGQVLRADLGRANSRYFLAIAGVGFDATVTRVLRPATKRRLGVMAYVIAAIAEAIKLRGSEAFIYADGRVMRRRILMVAACNTRLYGGVLRMAPGAFVDDGLLDVSVFYGRGFWPKIRHVVKALFGLHPGDPEVEFFQTADLRVESRDDLPVQLDGDYFDTIPVHFHVVPRSLKVIVPPGPHPQFRSERVREGESE